MCLDKSIATVRERKCEDRGERAKNNHAVGANSLLGLKNRQGNDVRPPWGERKECFSREAGEHGRSAGKVGERTLTCEHQES